MSIKNTGYLPCSVMLIWALWRIGIIKNSNFRAAEPQGYSTAKRFYNLNFFYIDYIYSLGCARWGASGALFPKSASCGTEFPLKGLNLGAYKSS